MLFGIGSTEDIDTMIIVMLTYNYFRLLDNDKAGRVVMTIGKFYPYQHSLPQHVFRTEHATLSANNSRPLDKEMNCAY